MKRTIVPIIAAAMMATSCEKVIQVDLETAPPRLVIDASIDWYKHTAGQEQKIKLSTTTGYYSDAFPTVSGATITITNAAHTVFEFTEGATKGEYICSDFKPVIGDTYQLTVVLNGITYTATETMTGTPAIDDVIKQTYTGGMTGDEVEIEYSFPDDGTQNNYYMMRIKSSRVAYPEYFLENDERYQGNKMIQYYSHEDLEKGDALNIRLYGASRRFWDYFRKVVVAAGNDDSPFPTTPTAVRGNITNQANEQDYVLGYFRLSEIDVRDYTIQ